MSNIRSIFICHIVIIFIVIFFVFPGYFGLKNISAGDAGFYFLDGLKEFFIFPYLWSLDGLGNYSSLLSPFPYFVLLMKMLSLFNFSWSVVERIAWYWPFLILSVFSSRFLLKTILPETKFKFLASFVYLFNTYILMIIGGGQISIALAYAITPLMLGLFIRLVNYLVTNCEVRVKEAVIAGVVLALQISFEPRIALIALIAVGVYLIFQLFSCKLRIEDYWLLTKGLAKSMGIPLVIVFLLHFYWILPTIVLRKESYAPGLSSASWVKFLSFAKFSNSLSLLHPNWPENIFGKTYFMRPEFIILPILAFSSLLFINYSVANYGLRGKNRKSSRFIVRNSAILFFAFLGLIGAFLAKGSNPPWGEVYVWLFKNVPGMNLFRDASKFYVLVALSYSILIPFSVAEIFSRLRRKFGKSAAIGFVVLVVGCLLFLIRPAWSGQLGGTFKARQVPQEYLDFKDFISNQSGFFRTFWISKRQRFGFYSNNHPAVDAESFATGSICRKPFCSLKKEMPKRWRQNCSSNDRCYVRELSYFLNPKTAVILSQMAVKYVIVPLDPEGEIFLASRKYSSQQRQEVEEFLDTIPWLKKIDVGGKIAVYELPRFKDHFFAVGGGKPEIKWQMINPAKYKVEVENANQPFKLVFSETYDELWQAKIGSRMISSRPFNQVLNSFEIPRADNLEIEVYFAPQKYVYYGGVVSLATLFLIIGWLLYNRKK